jgi:hypothetical protein
VRGVIRIGGGKWKFYWSYEAGCPPGSPRFSDDLWALRWLQQFNADGFSAAAFRSMLANNRSPGLQCFSEEEVLRLVAHKLVTGEIRISGTQPETSPAAALRPPDKELSPAFPLGERKTASSATSGSSAPYEEEAVLASNADLVAIAAVLKEAARVGTPF